MILAMSPSDSNGTTVEAGGSLSSSDEQHMLDKAQFLVHKSLKKLPVRDFCSEVRAARDLMSEVSVILDCYETDLIALVKRLVSKMFSGNPTLVSFALQDICFSDSENIVRNSLVSAYIRQDNGMEFDSSFLCIPCTIPINLKNRCVGVCRLTAPINFGPAAESIQFVVLVVGPANVKATKTPIEVSRTFATILSDASIRYRLLNEAKTETDFKRILTDFNNFIILQSPKMGNDEDSRSVTSNKAFYPFRGIINDLRRRLPHYLSDFVDGVKDHRSIYKTISTTVFLYFSILLPVIAFGTLNNTNTNGQMNVRKTLISQVIGGLFFSLISGQPLVILMTTAPLSLFIKVVYSISEEWNTDFRVMYGCVGLFCSACLLLYAIFDSSRIMRWCTRSTEEIFSLFISVAFFVDAGKDTYHNLQRPCQDNGSSYLDEATGVPGSLLSVLVKEARPGGLHNDNVGLCRPEVSLLFIILMLATLWLGLTLFNLTRTPYLSRKLRELLSDYALPFAVITVSLFGVIVFPDYPTSNFTDDKNSSMFTVAHIELIKTSPLLISIGLGFALSLLFVMDQNISAAMVDTPAHKLTKGAAFDWDILVVALLNGFLSMFGLPWMHGVLPHSPLHAQALADSEELVVDGYVQHVVIKSRETRVTSFTAHVLLGLSVLLLPQPLGFIPTAVLDGLFLFMAISSLRSNQFFERLLLIITEQMSYPPNHYVRRCSQKSLHIFTGCQLLQLIVFCFVGFSPWPYLTMAFPVIIVAMLAVRQFLVPLVVDERHLKHLDSKELH